MFSWPMITGPPESGCLNIFTSVPQMPATAIFMRALSSSICGIGNSRTSNLPAPIFTEARTFSTVVYLWSASAEIKDEQIDRGDCAHRSMGADPGRALQQAHHGSRCQHESSGVCRPEDGDGAREHESDRDRRKSPLDGAAD